MAAGVVRNAGSAFVRKSPDNEPPSLFIAVFPYRFRAANVACHSGTSSSRHPERMCVCRPLLQRCEKNGGRSSPPMRNCSIGFPCPACPSLTRTGSVVSCSPMTSSQLEFRVKDVAQRPAAVPPSRGRLGHIRDGNPQNKLRRGTRTSDIHPRTRRRHARYPENFRSRVVQSRRILR